MIKWISIALYFTLTFSNFLLSQTNSILIDFGTINSEAPWNNIQNPHDGSNPLNDVLGATTEVTLTVIDSFNYINTNGTTTPLAALNIPASASSDSFYGNQVEFADDTQPTAGIRLNSLDPTISYTLKLFASRLASDNRETLYTINGEEEKQFTLDVADNSNTVIETSIKPRSDGSIEIFATTGPNNTNPNGFYYLGALKVEYPDPNFEQSLSVRSPNGGEYWQVGKTVELQFNNTTNEASTIEYSINNGLNWNIITELPPLTSTYDWTIPNVNSEECLIRVTHSSLTDLSDSVFTITNDSDNCPIVVIGSSTAEGIGATVLDSAWVYRYEASLYQRDTRFPVINLGRGGYTTYHLLPTQSSSAASVGITIDQEKNITKALSFDPSAIIINLPSNDAANYFPVSDQMNNFREMVASAEDNGVPTWVCTTQPRNFGNSEQIDLQVEGRDSILNYFGEMAIDFWTDIADDNGNILDLYNSGDGVHLNDDGHKVLYSIVTDLNISSQTSCEVISSLSKTDLTENDLLLFSLSPNPTDSDIYLTFNKPIVGLVTVSLTNIDGKSIEVIANNLSLSKDESIIITESKLSQLKSSLLYVNVKLVSDNGTIQTETLPLFLRK